MDSVLYHVCDIVLFILDKSKVLDGHSNDLWKYDIGNTSWEHLSGSQRVNTRANYTEPYPGGVCKHAMEIDSIDSTLYVFGGSGYSSSLGILCSISNRRFGKRFMEV